MKNNNAFARRLLVWTGGGSGGGGGGGVDIKVKVSAADTTTDYLSSKLSSSDGTVTFTILNPGGDEEYDVSIAPIPLTVAAAQAAITGSSLLPGRMYLITDAFSNRCQIFLWAVASNSFDQDGWGSFSNNNTTSLNAFMKYDVVSDVVYEVWVPKTNIRILQSVGSGANAMTLFPLSTNASSRDILIEDCTFNLGGFPGNNANYTIQNCTFKKSTITFGGAGLRTIQKVVVEHSTLFVAGALDATVTDCHVLDGSTMQSQSDNGLTSITYSNITANGFVECLTSTSNSEITKVTVQSGTLSVTDSSAQGGLYRGSAYIQATSFAINCEVLEGGFLELTGGNIFTRCKVGMGKTVVPAAGYNATNGFLENLDSTFEVFLNPDISGLIDMAGYQFAGVVRIGTTGVPASWELKQLQNFPTDHIFCIVPADSNTVDVYDAGAGGVNLYLNVAAVVTYDGTKDDTLVVRSGLNDYTRVFQIGGWQAPSA